MPHSLVHRFLAAVFAAIILIVPTDSLAQASPYPVGRARPFRVVPAGTLLEIDRALSKDPVKQVARVSLWPDDAFLVVGELDTKLLGRFSRAVILRVGTDGVRIMEREKEIAKMTILHFEPAIENAMMGGAVPTTANQRW